MTPRVHTFFFVDRPKRSNPAKPGVLRDGAAALEILPALQLLGFERGEPLLNMPPDTPHEVPPQTPCVVDVSCIRSGDLLYQPTRPPMHDGPGGRKTLERAHTDLEQLVIDKWAPYLEICARNQVMLARRVRPNVAVGFEDRRQMTFSERMGAPYKELNTLEGGSLRSFKGTDRTAVFLLRVDELYEGGPGLLGAFGMDSFATQVWSYRLGRDFSHLLPEPGFVVAELTWTEIPKRPTNYQWAMDLPIEILVRMAA